MKNETMKAKMFLSIAASDVIQEFKYARSEGRRHEEVQESWDDVIGEKLDRGEVLKARAVETQYIRGKRLWSKIKRSDTKTKVSIL